MQVCLYIVIQNFGIFLKKRIFFFFCKLFFSLNSSFSVRWALTKRQSMVSYPSTPHKYLSLFMCTITIKVKSAEKHAAAAAAAKSLQSCPTLCDPIDGSPPGFLSLGFSRQEHWSGSPLPSPMHESEK